jgi:class 3 adenylate cyclase
MRMVAHIKGVLSIKPDSIGLTFGLEQGTLVRFEINENTEYIGRAINVAARLQGAVKQNEKNPEGVVLMSMNVFDKVKRQAPNKYGTRRVTINLNNVAGGESYIAMQLNLVEAHGEASISHSNATKSKR